MAKSLDLLIPAVAAAAIETIGRCADKGVDLIVYCTLRRLDEQAILYRQSRSTTEIKAKQAKMSARGFDFLADVIDAVGPHSGPTRTNAAPGESYHNYAMAFDAAPVYNGKLVWTTHDDLATADIDEGEVWQIYGSAAQASGLNWSGAWAGFREYAHSQMGVGGNPLKQYKPTEIKAMLVDNGLLEL